MARKKKKERPIYKKGGYNRCQRKEKERKDSKLY